MEPIDGRSVMELEDENLVTSQPMDRKTCSLDVAPRRSFFGFGTEEFGCKYILNSTLNSIKIVLFSSKLNLLASCGPLAIIVDKLTNHHVSFNFVLAASSFNIQDAFLYLMYFLYNFRDGYSF